jgi:hypothetical protein
MFGRGHCCGCSDFSIVPVDQPSATFNYLPHGSSVTNFEDRLTGAQKQLVRADEVSRALVLAGPGAGKTHTLIRRLAHLIEVQGLSPFTDILVLSFSRATVGEIRDRLELLMDESDKSETLAYRNIRTFDSFATRLIAAAEDTAALPGKCSRATQANGILPGVKCGRNDQIVVKGHRQSLINHPAP